MHEDHPLELCVALENLEYWLLVEVRPGDDPELTCGIFDELAAQVRELAQPSEQKWIDQQLLRIWHSAHQRRAPLHQGRPPTQGRDHRLTP